jgi:Na+/proline symporter
MIWEKMELAKKPVAPIRAVSILVGVMIGCILAYAYQVNLPTLFYEMNVAGLVAFVAIPMLAGFVVGLLNPSTGMRDGLLVGLLSGLFNSIMATIKLIYAPEWKIGEVYAFSVFAIMSVFVWMILGAVAAELAKRFYE